MSFDSLTPLIIEYRYWIIIPLAFVEGPIVAFLVGTLSSFGYFDPYVAIIIFFFKDLTVDGAFYFLGRYANTTATVRRWLNKSGLLSDGMASITAQWRERGWRTMFISKLPHGLSPAFLATAGMVNFSLKRFWVYGGIIALMQYGLLFVLGYYLGSTVGVSSPIVDRISVVVTLLLFVGGAYYAGMWYLRRRFIRRSIKSSDE